MENKPLEVWRVLLVDDDEDDYLLTRSMLNQAQGRKVELDWAPTYQSGQLLLQSNHYHAVLVDYDLGARNGIELIRETVDSGCSAPLILFTGRGSYEIDMEAMQVGAALYLTKAEANPLLLERSLRYAIERKRFEVELDRRLQERSNILQSIQDGFFAVDRDWRFTYINQRAAHNGGFEPEELLGQNIWQAFPKLNGTLAEENYRRVMNERRPVQFEMNGVYQGKWYNISVYPSAEGISIYWQDNTERKQAEEALRNQVNLQAQLTKIAVTLPGMISAFRLRPDGSTCMPYASPELEDLYGLKLENVLEDAAPIFSMIHPEDIGHVNETIAESAMRLTPWRDEYRLLHPTKGEIWIEGHSMPQLEPDGSILWYGFIQDITERKQAEEALRRYELLAGHSRDIILFMRREDGRILEANAAAISAYGYNREELLALTIQELRALHTHALTADQMARADAKGILFETIHRRKDGSTFPVEVSSRGASVGGARTLISVVRDITERKQAEEAVRLSQGDLARAQSVAHTGSWRLDIDRNELLWSDEVYRMFEIRKGTPLTYQTFLAAVHPDDLDFVDRSWMNALHGEPYDIEHRILVGEHVKWVRERAELEFDQQGRLLGGFGIVHDVTPRKQAEVALRESEERYRSLFNNMTEGFATHEVITDESGQPYDYRFLDINLAFERLTGLKREDVIDRTHNEILPGDNPKWVRIYGEVALTGEPVHFEDYSATLKRHYEVYSYRPAPRQFAVIFMDITERKQAELALAQANTALHTYAEQLKRSNLALEDFAFIASHDLREPLRKIKAFGDLLKSRYSQELDEQGQDYVERMQGASGRMQSMLDGLLTYARVTTQGQAFKRVDFNQIASEVLLDLEMRLSQTGGRVEIGPLPIFKADPVQMRQLLQNLLGNALKFHRPGVPPLVTLTSKTISKNCIELIVEDNGIGFEMSHARHLFKPFHRVKNRSGYEGTGMGLAICRKIVERHGGSVSATSQPGKGSTFMVTLTCEVHDC